MAAVLLRRVFLQLEYKDMVNEIDAGMLKGCQAELLVAIQAETNSLIQRKICDAVAELARSCIGKWTLIIYCTCRVGYLASFPGPFPDFQCFSACNNEKLGMRL